MESISKYNFHGIEYVELSELNELLHEMIKNYRVGEKPGFIIKSKAERVAATGSLYHLSAVLNKESIRPKMHERLEDTRKKREAIAETEKTIENAKAALKRAEQAVKAAKVEIGDDDEDDEEPGDYMVVKRGEKPREWWFFREWDNGKPVIGQNGGMVFTYKSAAEHMANRLGEGWNVVDVSEEECEKCERLLSAIFSDEDDDDDFCEDCECDGDCENCDIDYCGDGVAAEDEDWDGDEDED